MVRDRYGKRLRPGHRITILAPSHAPPGPATVTKLVHMEPASVITEDARHVTVVVCASNVTRSRRWGKAHQGAPCQG